MAASICIILAEESALLGERCFKVVDQYNPIKEFVLFYLGTNGNTKTDVFSEKFQKGGGSFPIQKFILQILDF